MNHNINHGINHGINRDKNRPPEPLKYFKRWTNESFSLLQRFGEITTIKKNDAVVGSCLKRTRSSEKNENNFKHCDKSNETIEVLFNDGFFYFKFIISSQYPFCEPDFYINGWLYKNWLTHNIKTGVRNGEYTNSRNFKIIDSGEECYDEDLYKKNNSHLVSHINVPCFCCDSIINNWSAGCLLNDVINEFYIFRENVLKVYGIYWLRTCLERYKNTYDFRTIVDFIWDYVGRCIL